MAKVVGIDLGTTNSVVAVLEGGKPVVIPNAEGNRLTPSIVGFTKTGERLVGELAKRQAVVNPENTVYSIKRFMGRFMNEVGEEMKMVPYKVVAGPQGEARVRLQAKDYSPQEISSMILQKLKNDAERYLGEAVTKAVITVPAYFNDAQRSATKEAGQIAGLEVLRIINEPTASAMAYGFDKQDETLSILVFDLGGGTFDVSILEVGGGVFQVKSTNGDTHLGGDNWDQLLVNWMAEEFKKQHGIDLRQDRMALQRLKEAAEKAKIELSQVTQSNINLPFITADASGAKHLDMTITRAEFEKMSHDLVERCAGPTKQAITDSGLAADKIDRILLVGGATRMPMIQEFVKRLFGKEPNKDINPDECVALGAAVQGGVLVGDVKNIVLVDVTPLTLGIEVLGGYVEKMIERNTAIPTSAKKSFTTASDGQTGVEVHVLQGERAMAGDNKSLGRFQLTEIPPAPRGVPQIEVTFEMDSNGILNVNAKELASGKSTGIKLTGSTNLPKDEISKMVKEAEAYSEADKQKREEAEVRSEADSLVYTTEKTMKDIPDVEPGVKTKIEEQIKSLKEALAGTDIAQIKGGIEPLKQALYEVTSAAYAKAGAAQGAPGGGPGPTGKTVWTPGGEVPVDGGAPQAGVIDADYTVEGESGGNGKK